MNFKNILSILKKGKYMEKQMKKEKLFSHSLIKNTKWLIFSIMASVLIIVISIGFTSCDDNKEPKLPDISEEPLMKTWYRWSEGHIDKRYTLRFKEDRTYAHLTENETINGIYRITEKEKGTYNVTILDGEVREFKNATHYKILASGSNVYNQMWVYYLTEPRMGTSYLYVLLYLDNTIGQLYSLVGTDSEWWEE